MIFKTIFTWWNRHTFGTFLKTLISGKYVGCDELGNKYYSNKAGERWVLYSKNVDIFSFHTLASENTGDQHKFLTSGISVPEFAI